MEDVVDVAFLKVAERYPKLGIKGDPPLPNAQLFGVGAIGDSLSVTALLIDLEEELMKMEIVKNPFMSANFFERNSAAFLQYHSFRRAIADRILAERG